MVTSYPRRPTPFLLQLFRCTMHKKLCSVLAKTSSGSPVTASPRSKWRKKTVRILNGLRAGCKFFSRKFRFWTPGLLSTFATVSGEMPLVGVPQAGRLPPPRLGRNARHTGLDPGSRYPLPRSRGGEGRGPPSSVARWPP
jgi:hypothetical protein